MTREQQQRTKIKICGLKRLEDITYVNEAKPDYCGFIIEFSKSSRNVTGVQLRELTARLDSDIIPVGVFVNAAPERVEELLLNGTIHIAQLHGQEDETYIRRIQKNTGHQVIKAFSVKTAQDIEKALKSPADYILLDQGGGGTGQTFFSGRRTGCGKSGNSRPDHSSLCSRSEQQCGDGWNERQR